MVKMVLAIEGMGCGMCEAHVNDSIRNAFKVKKVTSSASKGETVIIAEDEITKEELENVINPTGYTVLSVTSEPYQKKGLFGR